MVIITSIAFLGLISLVLASPLITPTILYAQTSHLLMMFISQSNSMAPTLRYNDKILVDTSVTFQRLKVGDIIAFKTFGTNSTGQHLDIIHRVAQIVTDSNGDRIIRAKGDANNDSIPSLDYPIFQQNYVGKVVYRITSGNFIGDNNTSPKS